MAGLYVHVPFCLKKCFYCDFYSVEDRSIIDRFFRALLREIQLRSDSLIQSFSISTLYFGGGTPSLLQPEQIRQATQKISEVFPLSDEMEITLEVNPATRSKSELNAYFEVGINRLSIGVQSFLDNELALLGRVHTVQGAEAFIALALESKIPEISIDLIYGLPGQTIEDWHETLQKVRSFEPSHLSAYSLTWSEKTLIGQEILSGRLPVPQEDDVIEMALHASTFLSDAGYEHYEVSNFALPGHRCRHNEGYWNGEPYIGFGPSAHSYLKPIRFWNISDVKAYMDQLSQNKLPVENQESLSHEALRLERIALGLRCSDGVAIKHLKACEAELDEYIDQGLAIKQNGYLILTQKGLLLADEIALQIS